MSDVNKFLRSKFFARTMCYTILFGGYANSIDMAPCYYISKNLGDVIGFYGYVHIVSALWSGITTWLEGKTKGISIVGESILVMALLHCIVVLKLIK